MLELTNSLDETFYVARRAAIDFAIPLVTNVEQVPALTHQALLIRKILSEETSRPFPYSLG